MSNQLLIFRRRKPWAASMLLSTFVLLSTTTASRANEPVYAEAVQQTVTGAVTSSDNGETLPGVTVRVKGTDRGTVTNAEGVYSIQASAGDVLVFSFIGFTEQEVTVDSQATINVTMSNDSQVIDEVVVIGYGTQKRSEVTSSVATVRAEDFNSGGSRSPMDVIQSKVAGLNITRPQGNNPNSGTSIQLRGVTSLTGTRNPLIVIDGIPGGNLDLLQQEDIESFDVLKDGSAAAIYGTRGNAGVILITTKKGKAGDPQFEYSTYFQREFVDRIPEVYNAAEFRQLIADGAINESQDFGASTNLFDELVDKSNLSQYHTLSASVGSQNTNYRESMFYNDANGIAKRNGREQWGGRLNINQTGLQDMLTMQVNLAANFNKADRLGGQTGDFEQAVQRNPPAPLYNEDGTFYQTQAYNNYNPLSRLAHRIDERDQSTFSADAKLSLKILEGLTASAFGSYVRNNWNDRYYRSMLDWDQRENSDYQ